jgi:hypothetical protein
MSTTPDAPVAPEPASPSLTVWQRTGRVFVRPFQAWEGLATHVQWWFPLVVVLVIQVGLLAATYHRVLLPTMIEQWSQAVENGQMPPAQFDKISAFFSDSPIALLIIVAQQALVLPVAFLLAALVVWFGAGFVLGTRFSFRLGLEVVSWASLVRIPETILTFAIAWSQETLKGIHFGLAAFLPVQETPTKLHGGLAVLLDSVGPFPIWYLFVAVLGCSTLSGAPRKSVAWVLSGLYLAITVIFAVVAAMFGPGA